jgi:hypothetical protein
METTNPGRGLVSENDEQRMEAWDTEDPVDD